VKVDLYIAASIEGFIADEHGGTDWVCDEALFEQTVRDYGCICMGHATYDEYGGPAFEGVQCIVLTHKIPKRNKQAAVHFVTSAEDAMAKARELGFKKLLVIGGAKTNQAFMSAGVVRKVYADIHPILLNKGLQMFGDFKASFDFKIIRSKWYDDGFMHAEYAVGQTHKAAVVVIIRDQAGRYFAHRRRADKKYYPGKWELGAGGKLDQLETPEAAAKRELHEQTSLKTMLTHCFNFDFTDGATTRKIHVFETLVKKPQGYNNEQWDEVSWMTAEQINELAADGQLSPDTKEIYQHYRSSLKV
jgi:dihydrofolate reductase/ADP-ribose pyrophosphatase YjhB (NUDIX family)